MVTRRVVVVRSAAGGVGALAGRTAAAMRERGWDVVDVALEPGGAPARVALRALVRRRRELAAADVVHVELGLLDLAVFWFAALAAAFRPVVVVAHDAPDVVRSPGAGLIRTGTRWRDIVAYRLLAPVLDRPLLRVLARRAEVAVVLSPAARERWLPRGPRRVVVVDHPADPPTDGGPPPSRGRHVLFAGFLTRGKGIEVLLDAWSVAGETTELPLLIAGTSGDPAYAEQLRMRGAALPRPPVWLGWVSDAELARLFAEAAVVVLPYRRSNPASGILVRALVEGRAVVASRVPAALGVLADGVDALLVPPGDAEALGVALARLLGEPALRDRLGAAAAARAAERFTWKRHLDGLEQAYGLAGRGR